MGCSFAKSEPKGKDLPCEPIATSALDVGIKGMGMLVNLISPLECLSERMLTVVVVVIQQILPLFRWSASSAIASRPLVRRADCIQCIVNERVGFLSPDVFFLGTK